MVLRRLAGDLALTSFTLKRPDYAELRYAGPDQLIIALDETPSSKSDSTLEDTAQLVAISGTQVLWSVYPRARTSICACAIWVRKGIEFNLNLLQAAGPGIPILIPGTPNHPADHRRAGQLGMESIMLDNIASSIDITPAFGLPGAELATRSTRLAGPRIPSNTYHWEKIAGPTCRDRLLHETWCYVECAGGTCQALWCEDRAVGPC